MNSDLLKANPLVIQSMSRKASGWDNAVAESLFRTLKSELIYQMDSASRTAASLVVFEFIEIWFNRKRVHASLGYLTPHEYEAKLNHHRKAA